MPRYKNKKEVTLVTNAGVMFAPLEEKDVNCYLYNDDLEVVSETPIPSVITHSGIFDLNMSGEKIIELNNTEECILDVIVQAPEGGIELYHNDKSNLAMVFEGVYQDQISSKFLQKIIIKATAEKLKGSYFIKKVG